MTGGSERASPRRPPWLALKVPPLALAVLFAVAMWRLPAAVPLPLEPPWRTALAALLAVAGAAFCIAGVLAFRRAGTTVNPTRPGAAATLVASGVYRVTRNPMYLGFALILLGLALWLAKLSALLLVALFAAYLRRYQIGPEEDALRERFGASFESYCKQVGRWL